jgi:hypothetical protein
MANRRRGEIAAVVDGEPVTLCLTLGALAELETVFGVGDLVALAERFATGRLSALDLQRIFAAALRGGGRAVGDDEVARMRVDGGLAGLAALVADLLEVTFGVADAANGEGEAVGHPTVRPTAAVEASAEAREPDRPRPVPGGPSPSPGTR